MREVLPQARGRCSHRQEKANRASAGSGWEGNGKLEEEGLSQEKTAQNRGTERSEDAGPGKKTGLAFLAGLRCGLRCPSSTKLNTRSGPGTRRASPSGSPVRDMNQQTRLHKPV